jgi:ribosomal protein S18 acetylase RimI-like enzyme
LINQVITADDIELTAKLAHKIWNQHYVPIIGQEQVNYMVEKFQSVEAITNQLNEGYLYYLIAHDNNPCGYLALVPDKEKSKLMISKIYVDADFRGLNLGTKLLNFTIEKAIQEGLKTIWLTVNKNNTNSINWYKKKGFLIKEKIEIDIGNSFIMDDYLLEKSVS